MSGERAFRHLTADELRWFPELDRWPDDSANPDLVDMFWLDADFTDGWEAGIGLYRRRPYDDGAPAITVNLLRPGHAMREFHQTFKDSDFTGSPAGGCWGEKNQFTVTTAADGTPLGFSLQLAVGEVALQLDGEVVAPGVKFSTDSPGFSGFRPETRLAVGWWPVTPRAVARGVLTFQGKPRPVTAHVHVERQVATVPLAGSEGQVSAQSIWSWGHMNCGDYTAIWTDSAAAGQLGYHHFTPFVLYRGGHPILSTFAFASYVEKFTLDERTGLARPQVTTLKASDGNLEFFARLVDGKVSDHFVMNRQAGSVYCRMVSTVDARLFQWGRAERITGRAIHEWGSQAGNFPFQQPMGGTA